MMEHPEQELLSAYLDEELDASERAVVAAHLPGCAACTQMLAALTATMDDLRALPEPTMPPEHGWALRGAIVRERKRGAVRWRLTGAAGAAAASIVAIVVFTVGGGSQSDTRGGNATGGVTGGEASTLATGPAPIGIGGTYDATSARALFGVKENAPSEEMRLQSSPAADANAVSASKSTEYTDDIARCEAVVFEGDPTARSAVRYEVATWSHADRRVPAFFLVYRVDGQDHSQELWVVTRTTCETLYFAQA